MNLKNDYVIPLNTKKSFLLSYEYPEIFNFDNLALQSFNINFLRNLIDGK